MLDKYWVRPIDQSLKQSIDFVDHSGEHREEATTDARWRESKAPLQSLARARHTPSGGYLVLNLRQRAAYYKSADPSAQRALAARARQHARVPAQRQAHAPVHTVGYGSLFRNRLIRIMVTKNQ